MKPAVKRMEQKNLDNRSISLGYFPDKIRKSMERRLHEKYKRKIKRITNCKRCSKPILPPFGASLCGDCMKDWDIRAWARLLARHHHGKATICMKCGLVTKKGMEWHHWDYEKPLDVISLCKRCHGLAHRFGREGFEGVNVDRRMKELE